MNKKRFVVPHDFTPVADIALSHAIATAKRVSAEIELLHVVAKDKQIADADKKLAQIISNKKDNDIVINPNVRIGSIFDDIGNFAAEKKADIIFMGTHGASGWQHIVGSKALKVITSSEVPFIVVQEKDINENGYDSIVVPLDLHKETKQKLSLVANMATYFKSAVHVVIPDESDEFLKNKAQANIKFAKTFFGERGIDLTVDLVPSSGFDKEIVKLGVKYDADLIAIMNNQKNALFGVLGANYEQYMITNDAKIPVMMVNPVTTSNARSVLFT
ncbi:MAG: universal stress protein [Crocinitomicaceae bacterium]|nr:universal stress protein [Crocinitomicaceae bacterium]